MHDRFTRGESRANPLHFGNDPDYDTDYVPDLTDLEYILTDVYLGPRNTSLIAVEFCSL